MLNLVIFYLNQGLIHYNVKYKGELIEVKNKKFIITGAGAGIGLELSLQMLAKGAHVAAVDLNSEGLNNLVEKSNHNPNLTTHVVDISNDELLLKFKEEYFNTHQIVDGIINNAGIIQPFIDVKNLEMDVVNRVMNVNFFASVKLTKMFLPYLLDRPSGHIVNVSSMGGFFPFPKQTIYGASKAALKIFTEGLYAELLDTKVKVMIVFPGAIATDILKNSNIESSSSDSDNSGIKMLSAKEAAAQIIQGMEKNKFQLYVGTDSKIMKLMYKLNPKGAISYINKKMKM